MNKYKTKRLGRDNKSVMKSPKTKKNISHIIKDKTARKPSKAGIWITVLAVMLGVLSPFAVLGWLCFAAPPQYDNTFLGELSDKYDRLYSIESPKIIIIGGSSTAFGIDSELLSEYMNMPVVNFGLYATLGTKVMLDLSEASINAGDIVVIAPETNEQTLSLYFNAETVWQSFDGNFSMLKHIKADNRGEMVGAFFDFTSAKLGYLMNGKPNPDGVYNHSSFNEYGDIVYERKYNIMPLGYDPNMTVDFATDMFSDDFLDYLNIYIANANKKGASVFYSFPPINESALTAEVNEDIIFNYYDFICRNLNCTVISNPNEYILEENYFYDSNFHLNDCGVIVRTANLIKDLNVALGRTNIVTIEIPDAPERQSSSGELGDGDNTYAQYFVYESFGQGVMISGVTEEAKLLKNIVVPASYEGKAVLAIGGGAFSGCTQLKTLTVNSNIIQFYDGIFSGCLSLQKVIMNYDSASNIAVGENLFDGAPDDTKLYFPSQEGYESFMSDYFWGPYGANGDRIKKG